MDKVNLVKTIEIYFEVKGMSGPCLFFDMSNYALNKNELIRAALRPNHLVLDDNSIYVKGNESSYLDKNGRNILKIVYFKSNAFFK